MADKILSKYGGKGHFYPVKMVDMGDDTWAERIAINIDNTLASSSNVQITHTATNSTLSGLTTDINNYLSSSENKLHSITYFTTSLVSVVFYAVVKELV